MKQSNRSEKVLVTISIGLSILMFQNCSKGMMALDQSASSASEIASDKPPVLALNSQKNAITNSVNVYSPSLILENGKLIMYFGGWIADGQQHDKVYRIECSSSSSCEGEPLIVLDSIALGLEHVNDPSVVKVSDSNYLMYITAVFLGEPLKGLGPSENHTFVSTSSDGIHWSRPQQVITDLWLPASTVDASGNVLTYGDNNMTAGGALIYQYNLGKDGKTIHSKTACVIPNSYQNLDVRWNASLGLFEMLGETFEQYGNQIDYLTSSDGIHWQIVGGPVVKGSADPKSPSHVRTPAFDPSNSKYIFYAETRDVQNSMSNQIYSAVIGGTKFCSATETDREYIMTSQTFFNGALKTSASAVAKDCSDRLQGAIEALNSSSWRCELSNKVIEQIRICVDDVNRTLKNGEQAGGMTTTLPSTQQPSVQPNSLPACVASKTDQEYLRTAVKFFDGAIGTAGEAQATACNLNLKKNIATLDQQAWPCAGTLTTIDYVRTCVGIVQNQVNNSK